MRYLLFSSFLPKGSIVKDGSQHLFSPYEKFIIAMLGLLQFTVVLDFMVLSPLGAILMPGLGISTSQFGLVVSAYAFSAGASGICAAGFADRFDRKKMLLFFYTGFICGTIFCGIANNYSSLLCGRIITGIFGGVIGSILFAIITDTFPMEVRGRVMGVVQMAFAASQVLGIPVGLYLATRFNWHAPFLLIASLGVVFGAVIALKLRPFTAHLQVQRDTNALTHLWHTATNMFYIRGYGATALLATGAFMLMPFSTTFLVNNVLVPESNLSEIFFVTGCFSIVLGPILGKLADAYGKYRLFVLGSLLSMVMVVIFTHQGPSPIWLVILINILLYTGISCRMITSSALISGMPEAPDRGAYMGINSSIQQVSGGVASFVSGLIVQQTTKNSPLQHYDTVGFITVATMLITVGMMLYISRHVSRKLHLVHA